MAKQVRVTDNVEVINIAEKESRTDRKQSKIINHLKGFVQNISHGVTDEKSLKKRMKVVLDETDDGLNDPEAPIVDYEKMVGAYQFMKAVVKFVMDSYAAKVDIGSLEEFEEFGMREKGLTKERLVKHLMDILDLFKDKVEDFNDEEYQKVLQSIHNTEMQREMEKQEGKKNQIKEIFQNARQWRKDYKTQHGIDPVEHGNRIGRENQPEELQADQTPSGQEIKRKNTTPLAQGEAGKAAIAERKTEKAAAQQEKKPDQAQDPAVKNSTKSFDTFDPRRQRNSRGTVGSGSRFTRNQSTSQNIVRNMRENIYSLESYIEELEGEVDNLRNENAHLRREQQGRRNRNRSARSNRRPSSSARRSPDTDPSKWYYV